MKKIPILLTTLCMMTFSAQSVSAEIKTFHDDSFYIMDKNEPIKQAQDTAFNMAIRKISESVGVYIDSQSTSDKGTITDDKMETFAAAVLKIKSKVFGKEFTSDDKLKITVSVDAEMDTDNVEEILNELIEAKKSAKDYEEVLKDYTKKKNQYDTVYGDYINSFQKRIMQKIRDGCKLQADGKLDDALNIYNEVITETTSEGTELSRAYIKRGHIYNLKRQNNLSLKDLEKAVALNNDEIGVHYAKGILLESRGDKKQAAQEYRTFIKDADIVYYDMEIIDALNRIVDLEL